MTIKELETQFAALKEEFQTQSRAHEIKFDAIDKRLDTLASKSDLEDLIKVLVQLNNPAHNDESEVEVVLEIPTAVKGLDSEAPSLGLTKYDRVEGKIEAGEYNFGFELGISQPLKYEKTIEISKMRGKFRCEEDFCALRYEDRNIWDPGQYSRVNSKWVSNDFCAHMVFDKMPEKDLIPWDIINISHARNKLFDKSFEWVKALKMEKAHDYGAMNRISTTVQVGNLWGFVVDASGRWSYLAFPFNPGIMFLGADYLEDLCIFDYMDMNTMDVLVSKREQEMLGSQNYMTGFGETGIKMNCVLKSENENASGKVIDVMWLLPMVHENIWYTLEALAVSMINIIGDSKGDKNADEIAKLFPNLFGQPSASLVPSEVPGLPSDQKLKIGVVLSGGQAPVGHNVISGIFDYLQDHVKGSTLYGFKGGPAGIMKGKYVELTTDFIYPYRNQGGFDMICSGRDKIETPEQFKQAEETALKLDLDGLIVIGGDDSNTNACLLAENFRGKNMKTRVIGCPKTIDGDLKCKEVPTSFGFDTACKIYAEMIGNVMIDARSTGKYYHFVRLMGRSASHITLECALQTHPNITVIGEEVAAKKLTLKNVTDYIVDVVCKRSDASYNYGVILIPEGLIDFIPEVQELIAELNEILAHEAVDEEGQWKKKLSPQCAELFEFLPEAIQEQLMLERDPHGNVQVAKIETEKMLIQMVETELEKRKQQGTYKGHFKGQSHFFGYEGRCGLPTNFDANYCYALGYAAGVLLHSGRTGLISSVGNLAAPVEEWTVGGTALTSLMDVERRHGKYKPVIKKAMVELDGAPFKKFASVRDQWALKNHYISPGPIQFSGPVANDVNHTLLLELGVTV